MARNVLGGELETCGNDPVGDRWCLCVTRWKEALDGGVAPPVVLAGCHEKSLEVVPLEDLRAHAAV